VRLDDGTQRPEPFPERATAPREQPDFVVSCLAYALGEAQAAVSWIAYTRLAKRWNAAGGRASTSTMPMRLAGPAF
jgi:hypothetical protein